MSTTTINWTAEFDGFPGDVSSVVLEDPGNSYGVIRKDTNGIVVSAGTPLVWISTGVYEYSFTDPAPGLEYRYYIKTSNGGQVIYYERDYSRVEVAYTITGRYSSQECLYDQFGQDNILRWATFSDSEDEATILQRIQNAVTYADNYVDDTLRGGPYILPFTDSIPTTISDVACILAGVHLYNARGIDDFAEGGNRLTLLALGAHEKLGMIRVGRMELTDYVGDNYMKTYVEPAVDYGSRCLDTANE